jgi:hypothetical protein
VSYSLWSRGRLLGTTELAYVRCMPRLRSGDLSPTDCADLLAAADRLEPLDLELRGPDGEIVPTERIFVRDTERLLALAAEAEREDWDDAEVDVEFALGERLEFDPTRPYDEGDLVAPEMDLYQELEDLEPREFPRWQIHVTLVDDSAIP